MDSGRTWVPQDTDRNTKALVAGHDTLLAPDDLEPCLAVDRYRGSIAVQHLCSHGRPCFKQRSPNQRCANSLAVGVWINVQPSKLFACESHKPDDLAANYCNPNRVVVKAFILGCLLKRQIGFLQPGCHKLISPRSVMDLTDAIPVFGGVGADVHVRQAFELTGPRRQAA